MAKQFPASHSCDTLCSTPCVNTIGQRKPFAMYLPKARCNWNCQSGSKDIAIIQLNNSGKLNSSNIFLSQAYFIALTTLNLKKIDFIYFRYMKT